MKKKRLLIQFSFLLIIIPIIKIFLKINIIQKLKETFNKELNKNLLYII